MSLKNMILSVTRRTKKGFTVGEIFDRVCTRAAQKFANPPSYPSVRARVYELENEGKLFTTGSRKDIVSGRESLTFRR